MAERATFYPHGTARGGAPHYLSIQGELIARASGATPAQYAQASSDTGFAGAAEGRNLAELATNVQGLVEQLAALQRDVARVRRRVTLTAFLVLTIVAVGATVYSGVLSLPRPTVAASPADSIADTPKKVEQPAPQPATRGPLASPEAPVATPSASEKPGDAVY